MYIYEQKDFPKFSYNKEKLFDVVAEVNALHSRLMGHMSAIGFDLKQKATLDNLSREVVESSKIEGENLKLREVRSSVARRLRINLEESVPSSLAVDGIVNVNIDAVRNYQDPLNLDRLFAWHANLFPTGYSDMYKIDVAKLRSDSSGAMRVVSLRGDREIVHFQAPPASDLPAMMKDFLSFANEPVKDLISVAIMHLWFLTLHPFEDGNGRIARAITEMALSKLEGASFRFYSLSAQIEKDRKHYYDFLEKAQKGSLDISSWIEFFLGMLLKALKHSYELSESALAKSVFWDKLAMVNITATQRKVLNRLLDGFKGNMTSSRWANICDYSQDTASREISRLLEIGVLEKIGAGRSTHYLISDKF